MAIHAQMELTFSRIIGHHLMAPFTTTGQPRAIPILIQESKGTVLRHLMATIMAEIIMEIIMEMVSEITIWAGITNHSICISLEKPAHGRFFCILGKVASVHRGSYTKNIRH